MVAEYKSRYQQLGFYVDGVRYKFAHGVFKTDDKKIQAVLDGLPDVTRVDKPEAQKSEAKPKASAKSSGK